MKDCLLCLKIRQELVGSIEVNSSKWQELNVQNVIEKHFWAMVRYGENSILTGLSSHTAL